jgi:predicted nucleotidyltransferase
MKTLQEIETTLNRSKQQLFAKYPIKSMAIFGSYARNEQVDKSDVDLVVEFNDKIGVRFIDLAEEIENIIGIKVDLVSKNGIKARYYESIKPDLIYV